MASKNSRQVSIELLRIIAMVMIIAHHLSFFGEVQFDRMILSVNRLWTQVMVYGGHVGVDIFVLISGYFMIESDNLRINKIVKLWLQMFFYSFGMYVVAMLFFGYSFTPRLLAISLTPFLNKQWPFASAFLALMLFAPFINRLIRVLPKAAYRLVLTIMAILWVIVPTFSTFDGESNYLLWMIFLYGVAAYVKLFPEDFKKKASFYIALSQIVALLSFLSALIFDILGKRMEIFAEYATHFSGMQHLNIFLWAFLMFLGFSKIPNKETGLMVGKSGNVINFVASLVFGIYLLHEDFFSRIILWRDIFDNNKYSDSSLYILITIGEILAIFVIGGLVEWIRKTVLEQNYMKWVTKLLAPLQDKIDGCMKDA